jgi:anti-sigma B factor antagonist
MASDRFSEQIRLAQMTAATAREMRHEAVSARARCRQMAHDDRSLRHRIECGKPGHLWFDSMAACPPNIPDSGEVLVLRVAGEVDLATVGLLREHLYQRVRGAHRGVVLDCTEVSLLAACGIGLLVEIADHVRARGMALRLVARNRVVLRALEVTQVGTLLPRAATVAEAVTQVSR